MAPRMAASKYSGKPLVQRARVLRKKQTPAEAALWEALRAGQCLGLKFRRQHQVGPHILDFYCAQVKLAIELDGAQHRAPSGKAQDHARDHSLHSLGIKVLRFPNATPIAAILKAAVVSARLRGIT